MKVRFLPLAQKEVDEAFAWYEAQSSGLGTEFLDELDRCIHRVRDFPTASAILVMDLRRSLFNRFPYGIIYGLDNDTLVVVAVAHLHREPFYWLEDNRMS